MLSVVITAWNEAANLPRVLASIKDLADEVVVVDTESTDDTVKVAKKLGCKVFTHPNTKIVEPVRNFSISKAKGDWILLLDADEEIPASLAQKIRQIILQNTVDFCRLPRRNFIFGKWITSSHWWPDYVYRLFKKGAVTWQETIHSLPKTIGVGYDLPPQPDLAIIHHNYSSIADFVTRLNRYTDVQSDALLQANYGFIWSDLLIKPANEFLNQYFARQGYSQGLHGLALSLLQAFSELIVYLKVWQGSGFSSSDISVVDQERVFAQLGCDFLWWDYESRIGRSQNYFHQILLRSIRKIRQSLSRL